MSIKISFYYQYENKMEKCKVRIKKAGALPAPAPRRGKNILSLKEQYGF